MSVLYNTHYQTHTFFMPIHLIEILKYLFFSLIIILVGGSQLCAQNKSKDEVNFSVGSSLRVKDADPTDSIFFSLEDALKTPDRVSELSLEGRMLKHFPIEILSFKNLQRLNISYNRINSLPINLFDKCNKLHVLQYAGNELQTPPAIVFHPSLTVLDLSDNLLTEFPMAIRSCKKLQELDLHGNAISTYPISADKLPSLKSLILSGNPLNELGAWVLNQSALKILFIDNTKIVKLPAELCLMSSLRFLNIEENMGIDLPSCMCSMNKLKVVMVTGTGLSEAKLNALHKCLPDLQIR